MFVAGIAVVVCTAHSQGGKCDNLVQILEFDPPTQSRSRRCKLVLHEKPTNHWSTSCCHVSLQARSFCIHLVVRVLLSFIIHPILSAAIVMLLLTGRRRAMKVPTSSFSDRSFRRTRRHREPGKYPGTPYSIAQSLLASARLL